MKTCQMVESKSVRARLTMQLTDFLTCVFLEEEAAEDRPQHDRRAHQLRPPDPHRLGRDGRRTPARKDRRATSSLNDCGLTCVCVLCVLCVSAVGVRSGADEVEMSKHERQKQPFVAGKAFFFLVFFSRSSLSSRSPFLQPFLFSFLLPLFLPLDSSSSPHSLFFSSFSIPFPSSRWRYSATLFNGRHALSLSLSLLSGVPRR